VRTCGKAKPLTSWLQSEGKRRKRRGSTIPLKGGRPNYSEYMKHEKQNGCMGTEHKDEHFVDTIRGENTIFKKH
jgi:hypothetical protein